MLVPFLEPAGLQIKTRQRRNAPVELALEGIPESLKIEAPIKLNLEPIMAHVLGVESDGNPVFTCSAYGTGKIFFMSVPLELALSSLPGAFYGTDAQPFWKVYRLIAQSLPTKRVITKKNPLVGLTEHLLVDGRRLVVAINYSPEPVEPVLSLADGWQIVETWYGKLPVIQANDAVVFSIKFNSPKG
jgi:hypothetical protein